MARLMDYGTGRYIREATDAERSESIAAAESDGGAGVITADGRDCYVEAEADDAAGGAP